MSTVEDPAAPGPTAERDVDAGLPRHAGLRERLQPVLRPLPGDTGPVRAGRLAYWLLLGALFTAGVVLPWARPSWAPQLREPWTIWSDPAAALSGRKPDQSLPPGTRFRDCADDSCPWLVVLPKGSFMRRPEWEGGNDEEGPRHQVTIGEELAVMESEVTRGQYRAFMTDTKRTITQGCLDAAATKLKDVPDATWDRPGFDQTDEHPVVCVSLNDSQAYALWLSRRTGAEYRLLSDAEWEYAARAGSQSRYSFGDDEKQLCRYGNVADRSGKAGIKGWPSSWAATDCDDGAVYTTAVKRYQPNAFGLYDMHGNAWEWVQDCWDGQKGYDGAPTDGSARDAASCSRRLLRGGAWLNEPRGARSADRHYGDPSFRVYVTGLRLARMLP